MIAAGSRYSGVASKKIGAVLGTAVVPDIGPV